MAWMMNPTYPRGLDGLAMSLTTELPARGRFAPAEGTKNPAFVTSQTPSQGRDKRVQRGVSFFGVLLSGWHGNGNRIRCESFCQGSETFVFFPRFLDHSSGNKVLQFFVGAESEHFLATACCIPGLEAFVDHVEQLFEFKRGFFCKNRHQLFSN